MHAPPHLSSCHGICLDARDARELLVIMNDMQSQHTREQVHFYLGGQLNSMHTYSRVAPLVLLLRRRACRLRDNLNKERAPAQVWITKDLAAGEGGKLLLTCRLRVTQHNRFSGKVLKIKHHIIILWYQITMLLYLDCCKQLGLLCLISTRISLIYQGRGKCQ